MRLLPFKKKKTISAFVYNGILKKKKSMAGRFVHSRSFLGIFVPLVFWVMSAPLSAEVLFYQGSCHYSIIPPSKACNDGRMGRVCCKRFCSHGMSR